MTSPTKTDLSFWNAPDEILDALYRLGGDPVPELRDAVVQLLDHEDTDVREEALRILVSRWKDLQLRPRAFSMLSSDSSPTVQCAAAFGIAATATETTRSADSRILIEVLRDDRNLEVRRASYDALIIVWRRGAGSAVWPFPPSTHAFAPARDVDWAWIGDIESLSS